MTGLRELLAQATPGPWMHTGEADDDWGFVALGESGGHGTYGFDATHDLPQAVHDARLIALAPELAQLCLDMGDALDLMLDMSARLYRDPNQMNYEEKRMRDDNCRVLLARLARIGGQT